MGKVPRRLKRFQRNGEIADDTGISLDEAIYSEKPAESKQMDKEVTMQIALDEVEKFKERNQRLPKKDEYDRIAESIYSQLKDQEQRKKLLERYERRMQKEKEKEDRHQKKGRKGKGIPGEEIDGERDKAFKELRESAKGLSENDIKDMSVEDLFGEQKGGKQETGSTSADDEFSLEGLSGLDSGPETQAQNTCPKCKAVTEKVTYCPECGAAFCEKCALNVEQLGAVKTLTCPECSKKIKR